jgi:hypothetical protein
MLIGSSTTRPPRPGRRPHRGAWPRSPLALATCLLSSALAFSSIWPAPSQARTESSRRPRAAPRVVLRHATGAAPELGLGEMAFGDDPGGSAEHVPAQILSPSEIVSLSRKDGVDLTALMVSAEMVRAQVVRERDLVRLSCVQDLLLQMKLVKGVANDAVTTLARSDIQQDELRLRGEFRLLEMGKEQLTQHLEEMQECVGADTPVDDGLGVSPVAGEKVAGPGEPDPTAIAVTTPPMERPVAASPVM